MAQPGATAWERMMRKILVVPAVVAACALVAAPVQAQFGGLLRKVTTPTPSPESDDHGGCPKGKTGSSVGRGILGRILRDAVGDAGSKGGVYSSDLPSQVRAMMTKDIACRLAPQDPQKTAPPTT